MHNNEAGRQIASKMPQSKEADLLSLNYTETAMRSGELIWLYKGEWHD